MVENYGETVQDRAIPNPIRTFEEAYADFCESLPWAIVTTQCLFFASHAVQTKIYHMHCISAIEGEQNTGCHDSSLSFKPSLIN